MSKEKLCTALDELVATKKSNSGEYVHRQWEVERLLEINSLSEGERLDGLELAASKLGREEVLNALLALYLVALRESDFYKTGVYRELLTSKDNGGVLFAEIKEALFLVELDLGSAECDKQLRRALAFFKPKAVPGGWTASVFFQSLFSKNPAARVSAHPPESLSRVRDLGLQAGLFAVSVAALSRAPSRFKPLAAAVAGLSVLELTRR